MFNVEQITTVSFYFHYVYSIIFLGSVKGMDEWIFIQFSFFFSRPIPAVLCTSVTRALREIKSQIIVSVFVPIRSSSAFAATAIGMVRLPPRLMGVTNKKPPISEGNKIYKSVYPSAFVFIPSIVIIFSFQQSHTV